VEGHSNANFDQIGTPDHSGLFKVTLRFREEDWDDKVRLEEKNWILQRARRDGDSLYLDIHVPAIKRDVPNGDNEWENMPWEIQWEW
jgi:hypothetical protein